MTVETKPFGWGTLIAIIIAVGVVTGVLLSLISDMLGLPGIIRTAAVGAVSGAAAVILISRVRTRQKTSD